MQLLHNAKQLITPGVIGASALTATIAAPGIALAHGSQSGSSSQSSGQSSHHQSNANTAVTQNNTKQNNDHNRLTCDQRQAWLNWQTADTQSRYQKRLNGLNILTAGTRDYVSDNGLTVANYEGLNATLNTDQTNAINAVNAITTPELNCPTDGSDQSHHDSAFSKASKDFANEVKQADTALNTYRGDVMKLFNTVLNS